ncbi:unnamed protein product, partial [Caretta caretta]
VNSQYPEYFVSAATFSSTFLEHVAQCHYSSDLTQFAQNLVDSYISQLLLEELVPDVFLETFAEFIKDPRQQALKSSNGDHQRGKKSNSEALQEMEYEAILQEVISQVVEEDAKALAHSVLSDYDAKMIKLQQSQVGCLIFSSGSTLAFRSSSRLPLKMFRWEISIKKLLRCSAPNLAFFHIKSGISLVFQALDVILTDLNNLAEEDMEDLLEYERGVQAAGSMS